MSDKFTFLHALSKNSVRDLRKIKEKYRPDEKIDPNQGKPELIEELVPIIPESEREIIVDSTFNTPKFRYTAQIGIFNGKVLSEDVIISNCQEYNNAHDYDDVEEYQTAQKESIKLMDYSNDEILFYYTLKTKKPEYDFDAMESRVAVSAKRIRVIIEPHNKIVSVFTGDKDIFNYALSALTVVFGFPITPLNPNKTQISNITRGSFSFHTVKVLDFIYHSLADLGVIGEITQIELETPSKSKETQIVKVQGGSDLLDDKSICEYLLLYSRDMVGAKLILKLKINGQDNNVNLDIGIKDNRVKIGIKKDNYSIEKVKEFFEIIQKKTFDELKMPGLRNEKKTKALLDRIRNKALK